MKKEQPNSLFGIAISSGAAIYMGFHYPQYLGETLTYTCYAMGCLGLIFTLVSASKGKEKEEEVEYDE